jgi:glyceraldehyde 3-phosphate dehydrogenase
VTDNSLVTVAGWYDNEWGFSCRMVEVLELMGKQLKR